MRGELSGKAQSLKTRLHQWRAMSYVLGSWLY